MKLPFKIFNACYLLRRKSRAEGGALLLGQQLPGLTPNGFMSRALRSGSVWKCSGAVLVFNMAPGVVVMGFIGI